MKHELIPFIMLKKNEMASGTPYLSAGRIIDSHVPKYGPLTSEVLIARPGDGTGH